MLIVHEGHALFMDLIGPTEAPGRVRHANSNVVDVDVYSVLYYRTVVVMPVPCCYFGILKADGLSR